MWALKTAPPGLRNSSSSSSALPPPPKKNQNVLWASKTAPPPFHPFHPFLPPTSEVLELQRQQGERRAELAELRRKGPSLRAARGPGAQRGGGVRGGRGGGEEVAGDLGRRSCQDVKLKKYHPFLYVHQQKYADILVSFVFLRFFPFVVFFLGGWGVLELVPPLLFGLVRVDQKGAATFRESMNPKGLRRWRIGDWFQAYGLHPLRSGDLQKPSFKARSAKHHVEIAERVSVAHGRRGPRSGGDGGGNFGAGVPTVSFLYDVI